MGSQIYFTVHSFSQTREITVIAPIAHDFKEIATIIIPLSTTFIVVVSTTALESWSLRLVVLPQHEFSSPPHFPTIYCCNP
jgi:hypothetical protein